MATAKRTGMRSETGGKRVTVYLDPAVLKQVRLHCAGEEISLSAFAEEAFKGALKATKKRG